MKPVYITHTASFLPNAAVSNDEMESVLGQTGDRPSRARSIVLRSNGIKSRYYAIDRETGLPSHSNVQLTAEAVRALQDDEFSLADMDLLSCGTTIPDQVAPGHGVMVHGELGTAPCEVNTAAGICVAGMAALQYARYAVASGAADCAVSTGSERISAIIRDRHFTGEIENAAQELARTPELAFEKDFLRWMLSDGAGAWLVKDTPRKNGLSLRIEWVYQRSYADQQPVCMYAGGDKQDDGSLLGWVDQPLQALSDKSTMVLKQDVKQLNANIVATTLSQPLEAIIDRYQLNANEIDWFLPHYSSGYFRERVFDALTALDFTIPYERWYTNLTERGNTGAASIYIMLDELVRSGNLKTGQKVLCYVPESGRFSCAFALLTVCNSDNP